MYLSKIVQEGAQSFGRDMANACILEFILSVYSCRSRLTLAFKYNAIMGFMSAFPLLTLYMFHARI